MLAHYQNLTNQQSQNYTLLTLLNSTNLQKSTMDLQNKQTNLRNQPKLTHMEMDSNQLQKDLQKKYQPRYTPWQNGYKMVDKKLTLQNSCQSIKQKTKNQQQEPQDPIDSLTHYYQTIYRHQSLQQHQTIITEDQIRQKLLGMFKKDKERSYSICDNFIGNLGLEQHCINVNNLVSWIEENSKQLIKNINNGHQQDGNKCVRIEKNILIGQNFNNICDIQGKQSYDFNSLSKEQQIQKLNRQNQYDQKKISKGTQPSKCITVNKPKINNKGKSHNPIFNEPILITTPNMNIFPTNTNFIASIFSRDKVQILLELYSTNNKIINFLNFFLFSLKSFIFTNQKEWILMKDEIERHLSKFQKNVQKIYEIDFEQQELIEICNKQLDQNCELKENQNRNQNKDNQALINPNFIIKNKNNEPSIYNKDNKYQSNLVTQKPFISISLRKQHQNHSLSQNISNAHQKTKLIKKQSHNSNQKRIPFTLNINNKQSKKLNNQKNHKLFSLQAYKQQTLKIKKKLSQHQETMLQAMRKCLFNTYERFEHLVEELKQGMLFVMGLLEKTQKFRQSDDKYRIKQFLLGSRRVGVEGMLYMEVIYKNVIEKIEQTRQKVVRVVQQGQQVSTSGMKNNEQERINIDFGSRRIAESFRERSYRQWVQSVFGKIEETLLLKVNQGRYKGKLRQKFIAVEEDEQSQKVVSIDEEDQVGQDQRQIWRKQTCMVAESNIDINNFTAVKQKQQKQPQKTINLSQQQINTPSQNIQQQLQSLQQSEAEKFISSIIDCGDHTETKRTDLSGKKQKDIHNSSRKRQSSKQFQYLLQPNVTCEKQQELSSSKGKPTPKSNQVLSNLSKYDCSIMDSNKANKNNLSTKKEYYETNVGKKSKKVIQMLRRKLKLEQRQKKTNKHKQTTDKDQSKHKTISKKHKKISSDHKIINTTDKINKNHNTKQKQQNTVTKHTNHIICGDNKVKRLGGRQFLKSLEPIQSENEQYQNEDQNQREKKKLFNKRSSESSDQQSSQSDQQSSSLMFLERVVQGRYKKKLNQPETKQKKCQQRLLLNPKHQKSSKNNIINYNLVPLINKNEPFIQIKFQNQSSDVYSSMKKQRKKQNKKHNLNEKINLDKYNSQDNGSQVVEYDDFESLSMDVPPYLVFQSQQQGNDLQNTLKNNNNNKNNRHESDSQDNANQQDSDYSSFYNDGIESNDRNEQKHVTDNNDQNVEISKSSQQKELKK